MEPLKCGGQHANTGRKTSPSARPEFESLVHELSGSLYEPGHPRCLELATPWAIATAASPAAVAESLKFVAANALPVTVQATGHGIASDIDGALLIHTRNLHNIGGLADHFLYSNDDMFFARPLVPRLFFTPGGITRFMLSPNRIGLGESEDERSGFENSARVNRRSSAPLCPGWLEREFPAEFEATAASTFRAAGNISVTNSLCHYYALLTGRAAMHQDGTGIYVDTASHAGLAELDGVLARRKPRQARPAKRRWSSPSRSAGASSGSRADSARISWPHRRRTPPGRAAHP